MRKKYTQYESDGMLWEIGEVPKCSYCKNTAKFETAHSGIVVCLAQHCHSKYIVQNCSTIKKTKVLNPSTN